MADQTAAEKRRELEEKGEFVSPTRVSGAERQMYDDAAADPDPGPPPPMTDSELRAEAERIFEDDLVDPAEVDADIEAVAKNMPPLPGLHVKLARLRAEFGFIGKTGTNTGVGGGYQFVEAVHVASRFVEKASALNLTMLPIYMQLLDSNPSASGKQLVYNVATIWRITDADSGEFIDVHSMGQGADSGDKALPKAQTNAMKYAILLVLQAAGDDPENDPNTDRIENTPSGPGVTVGPSNVPGVRQGGRQSGATEAQVSQIKRLAGKLDLTPDAFCILIDQAIGKMPQLPEGGENDEKRAILDFIGDRSFSEAADIVRTLEFIEAEKGAGSA